MNTLKTIGILLFVMLLTRSASAQEATPETDQIYVTGVAWSSDGTKIAAVGLYQGTPNGYIRVFDSFSGETLYALDPDPGGFTSVAWRPDDRFLAIGSYDYTIWVIDLETQQKVAHLQGHQSTVTNVDWNTDGSQLVSSGNWDELVILWNMVTYQPIQTVDVSDVWSVAFSPDSQKIAVGGGGGLRIFPSNLNVGDGQEQNLYRYFTNFTVGTVAWSHDGNRIAFGTVVYSIGNSDPGQQVFARLYVADANTGNELHNFVTQDEAIYGVEWSPDDRLLATYSIDGFVRVWDVNSGALLQSFPGITTYSSDVRFSAFGGRLAYGGIVSMDEARDIFSSAGITTIQDGAQALAGGAVQIVVPAPSVELLQSITERCAVQLAVKRELAAPLAANDLEAFVTEVEALPDTALPPGCAADLVAVAEALGAQ